MEPQAHHTVHHHSQLQALLMAPHLTQLQALLMVPHPSQLHQAHMALHLVPQALMAHLPVLPLPTASPTKPY